MGQFSSAMSGIEAGCVLADRNHLFELLQLAQDLGEEWLHWAELFAEHTRMAFILIYFDRSKERPYERPGAVLIAPRHGLGAGVDLVLNDFEGEDCRWVLLLDRPLRAQLQTYLREHSRAVSDPYFWDEQRRLH